MFQVSPGKKLYEQVVEQIKTMISEGTYTKGSLLPSEKELMEMTGVSRITIREALRTLSDAGVIETHKGKGSIVLIDSFGFLPPKNYDLSYKDTFLAITEYRYWLEPAVARHVAETASDDDLKQIGCALRENNADDPLEQFHLSIIQAAKNPILLETFQSLIEKERMPSLGELVEPSRQKSIAHQLQEQHERIFHALSRHNPEFAYFYMKEHLAFIHATYQQYFRNFY